MSKHTPGPWEWVGSNLLYGGPRGCDEILAARDDREPYGMHSALIEHHWDQEQAKANASLIAAAPELLDVLERAVRRLEIAHANGDTIMREWLIDARAAITKATGETE